MNTFLRLPRRLHRRLRGASPARGFATLATVAVLALVAALLVAWTQRHVWTERRAAAEDERAVQAHAAAEAGLDWLLARLHDGRPIDAACAPSTDPGARSFAATHLHRAAPLAAAGPTTWHDGAGEVPLAAACVRDRTGWQCSCPSAAQPTPVVDAGDDGVLPAFRVRLEPGGADGVLRVVSTGCLRADASCDGAGHAVHDPAARIEARLALLPALRRAPDAALVAASGVAAAAAFRARNVDGVAVWSGGALTGTPPELAGPPGSSRSDAALPGDPVLAALDADRVHARFFGMTHAAWRTQPAAVRVRCDGDCTGLLAGHIAQGARLLAIDGDLDASGPLELGSAARPVAVSASGRVRFSGDVRVHGVLAAARLDWRAASPAAGVRGALVVHGPAAFDAPVTLERDAAILAALRLEAGSWVRLDGSWKDH